MPCRATTLPGDGPQTCRMAAGGGIRAEPLRRIAWLCIGASSALALFLLTRPYRGVTHDALIYVGRAVADADPAGIGTDLLFVNDEQSRFSLLPRLMTPLVIAIGPAPAAMALALVGLVTWFAALCALAARFAGGRVLWTCLIAAAVLPAHYGAFGVFRFAEQFPTARPLAEAGVLAGLAALVAGRAALSAGLMVAAFLVHPIMALPGAAVWLAVQVGRDRRWLLVLALGALGLLGAAAFGLPPADRLLLRMDPAWRATLSANAYLFPGAWPVDAWAWLAVTAATVWLAIRHGPEGPPRSLLLAIVAVAGLGLAATWLLGERIGLVLAAQVQPWRALWLLSVAAALLWPVVGRGLWASGPPGRLALAMLAFAWLSPASPAAAVAAALGAVTVAGCAHRLQQIVSERVVRAAVALVGAYVALLWAPHALAAAELLLARPAGAPALSALWTVGGLGLPVAAAAVVFALRERWSPPLPLAAAVAALVVLLAVAGWDGRTPLERRLDTFQPDPALTRLLPDRLGPVLWLRHGAGRAWALAGRPNWISYIQGASMVFSRDLAAMWQTRMDRLLDARLGDGSDRTPHISGESSLEPSARDFVRICAGSGAPVAVIVPLEHGIRVPAEVPLRLYRMPAPDPQPITGPDGHGAWAERSLHAVIDCAALGPPAPGP
ncbi:MAG: hypothetical protein JWR08_1077 [Enterovirga sp.]|nr:hypothetical protein [Enterovirga sp.]